MAISGVNLTMGMDNTKALAGIKQVKDGFNDVNKVVSGEVTNRIKTLFSVAAIEEAARRTGEWAQKIEQTSKALGISGTMLQLLQTIAQKTNTPEEAVVGMFEHIAKARQDAINGNQEMISSFVRLGVSINDVFDQGKSNQDFVAGVFPKLANITNQGGLQRSAAQAITGGTPENFINSAAGSDVSRNALKEGITSGNIMRPEDVSQLSQDWKDTTTAMKEAFLAMTPIWQIITGLVKTVANAISGTSNIIGSLVDSVVSALHGNWTKILDDLNSVSRIIVNGLFGFLEFFSKIFSHVPGLHYINDEVIKARNNVNKGLYSTDKEVKQGTAIGAVTAAAMTMSPEIAATGRATKGLLEKTGIGEKSLPMGALQANATKKTIEEAVTTAGKGYGVVSVMARGAMMEQFGERNKNNPVLKGAENLNPFLSPDANGGYGKGAAGSGKGSMLSIGGIFGTGFSNNLIKINQDMLKTLNIIAQNTISTRQYGYTTHNFGGHAGGM